MKITGKKPIQIVASFIDLVNIKNVCNKFFSFVGFQNTKKKYFNIEPIQLIQGNKIYSKTIFAVILISQRDKQLIISSIFTYDGRLLLNHLMRCCLSISMLGSTEIFIRGQRTINAVCSCQHFCILFRIEMNSIDPA